MGMLSVAACAACRAGGSVCHDQVNACGNKAVGDGGAGCGIVLGVLEVKGDILAELCGQGHPQSPGWQRRAACSTSWQMPTVYF